MPLSFLLEQLDTPTGRMLIVTDDEERVRAVDWQDYQHRMERLLRLHYRDDYRLLHRSTAASPASRALQAYFDGDPGAIREVHTATNGTPFQRTVWDALRRIPTGRTIAYGTLALDIGRPTATRAVGLANGSNPIAIIVPCHRVIGSSGALTGYGGGIDRKRWLLAYEADTTREPGEPVSAALSETRPLASSSAVPRFTKLPGLAD